MMKILITVICISLFSLSFSSCTEYKVISAHKEKRVPGNRQGAPYYQYKIELKTNDKLLRPHIQRFWIEDCFYVFKDSIQSSLFFNDQKNFYLVFTNRMLKEDSTSKNKHNDDLIIFYRSSNTNKEKQIRIKYLTHSNTIIPN